MMVLNRICSSLAFQYSCGSSLIVVLGSIICDDTGSVCEILLVSGRVFCKKGCDADGETWDECLGECDEICYKDPVLKDKQWSAYIDRSPGSVRYSEECFRACIAGCSYKFDIPAEKLKQVHSRPPKPAPEEKPRPPAAESRPPLVYVPCGDEVLNTSA
ncbi:hypothetical protein SASPL_157878 [Salvia splendens]|uniref:Uncharacterized protein n=1 Tax=Salvia splendens TaxID=180675 RepID=A0A8X8VU81_SALSN|nr:hypothetical protein SASPL_157878 [Salvia splendens]